ncbi:hypothetical protein OSB04_013277 [Centaurea solstitialis]|uniref:Uncharacterized protein n=1 Tax=Centaurea solstitialis TaxID=347529 RepID=A0AA38TKH8_9ASTR|nr:hypothetical protein OSB04_013277 [Centaurea solstitialis]
MALELSLVLVPETIFKHEELRDYLSQIRVRAPHYIEIMGGCILIFFCCVTELSLVLVPETIFKHKELQLSLVLVPETIFKHEELRDYLSQIRVRAPHYIEIMGGCILIFFYFVTELSLVLVPETIFKHEELRD